MERSQYFTVNEAQILVQSFPGSTQLDTVQITIFNVGTSTTDVSAASMTAIGNNSWKYSWTPTATGVYLVKFYNANLDTEYFLYASVVGNVASTPSGSAGGSTLTNLRSRFLRLVDNYNANDLSGTNSSGDIADLCINQGLQKIYASLKASKFLQAYGSTALVSTIGQDYIELSAISDLDEIVAVKDTTNKITLTAITAKQYFDYISDPSEATGTSYQYCRIFNRIYLTPRPTAAITYTTEYVKTYPFLSADSDAALIPSRYDDWIYAEARVLWYQMEEPGNVAMLQIAIAERDRTELLFMGAIGSQFDRASQSASHFGNKRPSLNPYDHINL